jgi:hypothetical protein
MEQAGAFLVAGRLVVGIDRLEAWERRQGVARNEARTQTATAVR